MLAVMDVRDLESRLEDLPEILDELGSSQAELARHLNLDKSSVGKMIQRQRQLKLSEALDIADFITARQERRGLAEAPATFRHALPGQAARAAQVPVYGFPSPSGADRIDIKPGREIEFTAAPAIAAASPMTIGVRLPDDGLAPRYRMGERIYALRGLPPELHRDCLVEFKDGSATVRTFAGRARQGWRLESWRPNGDGQAKLETETLPFDDVAALHQVLSRA